ncbi:hypothetical protein FGO68_gene15293 [Halteria grandinella]|uniref:Uncharacterized protein n=1 Tax=Halteria grandinella TaxID=5974 RepID=A0A8J8P0E1_HALGN|nr:hypothetical protein FGO68_gene15293 [Halteria grandinella]
MDFDKRIVTLKELQRVVNELEQKAFDNEKKVSDLEHSLQSHILQYNLRMKTEKRARTNPTQLLKQTFIEGSAGEEQIGGPQSKFKKAVTLTAGRISAQRRSINAFNTLLSDIRNEGGQTSDQHDTDVEAVAAHSKANSKGLILNPIPTQLSKSIEIPEELVHQIEERVCNSQPIKRMIIENIQRLQNDLDAKLREQLELMRPKESMNLKDKMAKQLKEKMQQGVIQQQNEAISKLKEDFAQLNTKISELQTISTVIQRQQTTSSQDQRPMTADSVIPQPNEKSGTKQSEVVNMSGDAKNGNLFRSLKSSSNISSDGQNTNASEEVRTKPPMQVSSSLIPNN